MKNFTKHLCKLTLPLLLFSGITAFGSKVSDNITSYLQIQQRDTLDYWNVLKFVVTSKTTDAQLDIIKSGLKKEQVEIEFSDISRNQLGQLQSLSIDYKSKNSNGNYTITSSEKFIPIKIEYDVTGKKMSISKNSEANLSHTIPLESQRVKIPMKKDSANVFVKEKIINKKEFFTDTIRTAGSSDNTKTKMIITQNINTVVNDTILTEETRHQQWISDDGTKTKMNAAENNNKVFVQNSIKNALIFIDGEKYEEDLNEVSPGEIESVEVLKGKAAIKTYGEEAENGVILIKTKTSAQKNIKIQDQKPESKKIVESSDLALEGITVYAGPDSTDDEFDKNAILLKPKGITVDYSIKRDKGGKITKLKITLENSDGDKTIGSYASDDGIDRIRYGIKNGDLFVKSFKEQ